MRTIKKQKLDWERFVDIGLNVFIVLMLVIFEGKDSPLYFAAVGLLFLMFIVQIIKKGKILFDLKVLWMLVFFGLAAVSYCWAVDKGNVLSVLPILLVNEGLVYIIMNFIYEKKSRLYSAMKAVVVGAVLLGLRVALQYGLLVFEGMRMIDGLSANMLGLYAAMAANFCLYFFLKDRKWWHLVLMALCITIVGMSFSRKAIVFLFLPMMTTFVFYNRKSLKQIMIKLGVTIAAVVLGGTIIFTIKPLYDTVGYRVEAVINGVFDTGRSSDASVKARMNFIKYGKDMFVERPVQGWGLNNFKNMIAVRKPQGMTNTYAHNNYIELAVDLGVIGLVVYYSLYVYMFYHGVRNFKRLDLLQLLMLGILVTLAVCEYGIVSYYGDFFHLLLTMIWMALMYCGNDLRRVKKDGVKK